MKLLYVVNTKHDADAYRVYTRVHMDGRVTRVNQVSCSLYAFFDVEPDGV